MRRLSQITESIWSDMQDRGTGDAVKNEDKWVIDAMKEFIKRHPLLKEGEYEIVGLKLNIYQTVRIEEEDLVDGKLPFKFGEVYNFIANSIGLESLENSPDKVYCDFNVSSNNLKNFIGGPKSVGKSFSANFNKDLETLDGSPEETTDYSITGCHRVRDIKGLTPVIKGNLVVSLKYNQNIEFDDEDYFKVSNIKGNLIRRF